MENLSRKNELLSGIFSHVEEKSTSESKKHCETNTNRRFITFTCEVIGI